MLRARFYSLYVKSPIDVNDSFALLKLTGLGAKTQSSTIKNFKPF